MASMLSFLVLLLVIAVLLEMIAIVPLIAGELVTFAVASPESQRKIRALARQIGRWIRTIGIVAVACVGVVFSSSVDVAIAVVLAAMSPAVIGMLAARRIADEERKERIRHVSIHACKWAFAVASIIGLMYVVTTRICVDPACADLDGHKSMPNILLNTEHGL